MRYVTDIAKVLHTIIYVWRLASNENFRNPFEELQGIKTKAIYILANGPSLKELLVDMEKDFDKYKDAECFVMNDFVHDSRFAFIKPRLCVERSPFFQGYSDILLWVVVTGYIAAVTSLPKT
ncbi:hypothetical protein [Parabacteroides sp.]